MGVSAPDEELIATAFLDRYFIALSQHAVRVWNLVDDSHHYTISLPSADQGENDAMLAANESDETFAVVSNDADKGNYTLEVYSVIQPNCLFAVEFETRPAVVLASRGTRGFVVLFEDGSLRKVVSSSTGSRSAVLELVGKDAEEVALLAVSGIPAEIETAVSLLQPSGAGEEEEDAVASGLLSLELGEEEDDRPVVRPEQLAGIFETGLPPVGDMFRSIVGLYGRKPRARDMMKVIGKYQVTK
jgi:NET1-associated nuclear protein 1 (U3 small nucleolar RNA-associated protein 17)